MAVTLEQKKEIIGKYKLFGWLTVKGSLLRRGRSGTIGVACTLD